MRSLQLPASPKTKPSPKFRVSLNLPDKTVTKIRPTVLEALNAIEPPVYFKSKALIKLQVNKMSAEVSLWPYSLRKLFVNLTAKQILAKRLVAALK